MLWAESAKLFDSPTGQARKNCWKRRPNERTKTRRNTSICLGFYTKHNANGGLLANVTARPSPPTSDLNPHKQICDGYTNCTRMGGATRASCWATSPTTPGMPDYLTISDERLSCGRPGLSLLTMKQTFDRYMGNV